MLSRPHHPDDDRKPYGNHPVAWPAADDLIRSDEVPAVPEAAAPDVLIDLYDVAAGELGLAHGCRVLARATGAGAAALLRLAPRCDAVLAAWGDAGESEAWLAAARRQRALLGATTEVCTTRGDPRGPDLHLLRLGRTGDEVCVVAVAQAGQPAATRSGLVALQPYLIQAWAIRQRIEWQRVRAGLAAALLDRAPTGLAVLDQAGRVVFANALARSEFATGRVLRETDQRLVARPGPLRDAMDAALASLRATPGNADHPVRTVTINRGPDAIPLAIALATVASPRDDTGRYLLLVIDDPAAIPLPPAGYLREAFGLTAAESRVCQRVYRGDELDAIAAALGVSPRTAKTHLMHAYQKLGVRSRVTLAQRVGAWLWAPEPP